MNKTQIYFLNIVEHLKKTRTTNYKLPKDMKFLLSRYIWDDNTELLYKTIETKQLLCIPRVKDLTLHRISEVNDTPLGGHFGRDKTLANIAKNFFWPGMTKDVEDYVRSCESCQVNKWPKRVPLGLLHPHDVLKQSAPLEMSDTITDYTETTDKVEQK